MLFDFTLSMTEKDKFGCISLKKIDSNIRKVEERCLNSWVVTDEKPGAQVSFHPFVPCPYSIYRCRQLLTFKTHTIFKAGEWFHTALYWWFSYDGTSHTLPPMNLQILTITSIWASVSPNWELKNRQYSFLLLNVPLFI